MIKNATVISINSPQELTGGGHYLRCLLKGYSKISNNVLVIGKENNEENFKLDSNVKFKLFNKTLFSDFFSRLLLLPSFLFVYLFKIVSLVKNSDVISFHSSRLGVVVFILSKIYPDKKILCHFDNVEFLLLKDKMLKPSFSLKYFLNIIDYYLIRLSEYLCIKYSDCCTFITKSDADYFYQPYFIIPICYDFSNFQNDESSGNYYLFTASFDFEPNIIALNEFIILARNNPEIKFVVAGRKLDVNCCGSLNNLKCIDSPSVEEMDLIFKRAVGYISCVINGSGMKTKVAEAMRYGLPIYATENSLIGYECLKNKPYIYKYKCASDLTGKINTDSNMDRKAIVDDFNTFFSIDRVKIELERILIL
ncbi:glycosyltransferase [Vibrio anguillarum]|uniref:glycosyltransferase n=1 Tax=Vibrio anguillarum TaxID=55601 RepID=UPI0016AB6652|nr:glycosyltransferase [Vibrio anguillarum]MCC4237775.1 glycosyltransferase [Vibrio anguillarum]MDT3847654.1 glycosyltransferase [Vibrio anguillarum]NOI05046.1 glycosyltransferase [Vibrio anguillarum]